MSLWNGSVYYRTPYHNLISSFFRKQIMNHAEKAQIGVIFWDETQDIQQGLLYECVKGNMRCSTFNQYEELRFSSIFKCKQSPFPVYFVMKPNRLMDEIGFLYSFLNQLGVSTQLIQDLLTPDENK